MKQKITITLQYDLAIGKTNLNEIVYRLKGSFPFQVGNDF